MRSLRGRLTLGITLVLAVVLAGAGIVVSHYVDRSERAALDDRLKRTAELSRETALAAVQRELPPADRRLDNVLSATGTSLRLLLDRQRAARPRASRRRRGGRRRASACTRSRPAASATAPTRSASTRSAGWRGWRSRRGCCRWSASCQTSTAACSASARRRCSSPRSASGSPPTCCCARCAACARRRRGSPATEDLDRRVPGDDGPAELRSLAESFNEMLARLGRSAADRERALAATRRFTADAGHELRTPLTSVQANLSAISRHPDMSGAAARRDGRRRAGREPPARRAARGPAGARARRLGRGRARRRRAGRPRRASRSARRARATRRSRGRAQLPEEPVVVRGWEPGLRMLVDNLVENAARHGGGTVAVTLDADGPALLVDDDGKGVARGRARADLRAVRARRRDDGAGLRARSRARRPAGARARRGDRGRPVAAGRRAVRSALLRVRPRPRNRPSSLSRPCDARPSSAVSRCSRPPAAAGTTRRSRRRRSRLCACRSPRLPTRRSCAAATSTCAGA